MRKRGKIDINHIECVKAGRKIGALAISTAAIGDGFPDEIFIFRGKIFFVEFKKDEKAKLTPAQIKFHALCLASGVIIYRIHTPEELIELLTRT